MINSVRKDIWNNSYPIFLWLALEPIVGLIDSKIASIVNLDSLSAVGIGETVYFVFIWVFIFLAYGTTPLVSSLNTNNEVVRVGGVKYTIKDGIVYNSKLLLEDVKKMVQKSKDELNYEIYQPGEKKDLVKKGNKNID